MGLTNLPFAMPNVRIENPEAAAHARIGWFRSVSNIPHASRSSPSSAEMAQAAGKDPKDYLLELLGPPRQIDPRELNDTWNHGEDPTLTRSTLAGCAASPRPAAEAAGWGSASCRAAAWASPRTTASSPTWRRWSRWRSTPRASSTIPRVDIAVDCGAQVNPERVRSQIEGAVIMGMSHAMLRRDQLQERPRRSRTTSHHSRCCA